ncbi:MAG: DUF6314 family protein [Alphaproteobacteria bacterium]
MNELFADGAWPVDDIRSFMIGTWSLTRTINDLRQNMPGAMQGGATIATGDDDYHYREQGELCFGDYRETVHRTYRYSFPGPGIAEVCFDDGRPFYRLDLGNGFCKVQHVCGDDIYRGAFRVDGPDAWRSNWFISGPNKEIVLDSRYERTT